jgi:hypothetical protein
MRVDIAAIKREAGKDAGSGFLRAFSAFGLPLWRELIAFAYVALYV